MKRYDETTKRQTTTNRCDQGWVKFVKRRVEEASQRIEPTRRRDELANRWVDFLRRLVELAIRQVALAIRQVAHGKTTSRLEVSVCGNDESNIFFEHLISVTKQRVEHFSTIYLHAKTPFTIGLPRLTEVERWWILIKKVYITLGFNSLEDKLNSFQKILVSLELINEFRFFFYEPPSPPKNTRMSTIQGCQRDQLDQLQNSIANKGIAWPNNLRFSFPSWNRTL